MVISLNEVADQPIGIRAAVLVVVGILITLAVYGAVGLLVKIDDMGFTLAKKDSSGAKKLGRMMVTGMPKLLSLIAIIGTFAMLWVGGHILLVGADELGWHWLYSTVHHIVESVHHLGGLVTWLVETFFSLVAGLIVGSIIAVILHFLPKKRRNMLKIRTKQLNKTSEGAFSFHVHRCTQCRSGHRRRRHAKFLHRRLH